MKTIDAELHEQAEAILAKRLGAQGRAPTDYTLIEYAGALAEAEILMSRSGAAKNLDKAVEDGVLTRAEADGYVSLHRSEPDAVRHVLSYWGVDIPDKDAERRDPLAGVSEHEEAERLLVAEGKVDELGNPRYSNEEYLEALERVGYRKPSA
jgi:hypothetical protein